MSMNTVAPQFGNSFFNKRTGIIGGTLAGLTTIVALGAPAIASANTGDSLELNNATTISATQNPPETDAQKQAAQSEAVLQQAVQQALNGESTSADQIATVVAAINEHPAVQQALNAADPTPDQQLLNDINEIANSLNAKCASRDLLKMNQAECNQIIQKGIELSEQLSAQPGHEAEKAQLKSILDHQDDITTSVPAAANVVAIAACVILGLLSLGLLIACLNEAGSWGV